jgi:hypothetical protein
MNAAVEKRSPEGDNADERAAAELDRIDPTWRDYVSRVVDSAPPLTESQRVSIALLLRVAANHDALATSNALRRKGR